MFNPDICLCAGRTGNEFCTKCLRYKYYLRDINDEDNNFNTYFTEPPMTKEGTCDHFWNHEL